MRVDEGLGLVRTELTDEVRGGVRVPAFDTVVARGERRRRARRAAAGTAALALGAVVAVAVVVPGGGGTTHRVAPAGGTATQTVSPTTGRTPSGPAGTSAPPPADPYVVVPDGGFLAWTDTRTGGTGHFGSGAGRVTSPAVSADGRRVVYLVEGSSGNSLQWWDPQAGSGGTVIGATSPAQLQNPTVSADGRLASYYDGTGTRLATIGDPLATEPLALPQVDQAALQGGTLVYLPADGGACAVLRQGSSCLLTGSAVAGAKDPTGRAYRVTAVAAAGDTDTVVVSLLTSDPGSGPVAEALALVSGGVLRVLPTTVVPDTAGESVYDPVLLDRGSRLVFVDRTNRGQTTLSDRVFATDASGRTRTVVTTGADLGLGASGGS